MLGCRLDVSIQGPQHGMVAQNTAQNRMKEQKGTCTRDRLRAAPCEGQSGSSGRGAARA